MTDEIIQAEVEKIVREWYSYQTDGRLAAEITALCLRVRDSQRGADAKVCDETATKYSGGTFNDCSREVRAVEECAAAIRRLS